MNWSVKPPPFLRPFVQSFGFREAVVTSALRFPLPARPIPFMEFYLRDRYRIIDFESEVVTDAPRVVILGPQTRRHSDLHLHGDFAVFTIHFQPTGFHRLFGIPMSELTDQAIPAESILGSAVKELQEQLQQATSLSERVRVAEQFLLPRALRATPIQPVAGMAQSILSGHGLVSMEELWRSSRLSVRQVERQFENAVGVMPKRYARIVRFQQALTMERRYGEGNWTRIAAEAGYFDQMHLIKDFRAFSGQTPTRLQQAIRASESWNPSRNPDE